MPSATGKKKIRYDRRRAPRANVKIPVEIKSNRKTIGAQTQNISASGAYCTTDRFIPLNTELDVTLHVPDKASRGRKNLKEMKCHGIVVRNQPLPAERERQHFGLAIYFSAIGKDDKDELARYVRKSLPLREQQMLAKRKEPQITYNPGEVFSRADIGGQGFSVSSANFRVLGNDLNLSKNGIVCQTDRPIPLFREIAVNLVLPPLKKGREGEPEALQCSAVVVGCTKAPDSEKYDMAAYFVGLSPEQKKRLEECIRKVV